MPNFSMQKKLAEREAIDLSRCERTDAGDYILQFFTDGVDYCDAKTEEWIWSIGKNVNTGEVLASTSGKFYQAPGWKCLWLR